MPSDKLTESVGKLNNSLNQIYPLLSKIIENSNSKKDPGYIIDDKGRARRTKAADDSRTMNGVGLFMNIIVNGKGDAISASEQIVKILNSTKGVDPKTVSTFEKSMAGLVNTLSNIKSNKIISQKALNNIALSVRNLIQIAKSINETSFNNKKIKEFGEGITAIVTAVNTAGKMNAGKAVKNLQKTLIALSELDFDADKINKLSNIKTKGIDKNIAELVKAVSSISQIEKVNVNKSIRKFERILYRLVNIVNETSQLNNGKKSNLVNIDGLDKLIDIVKDLENVKIKNAEKNIDKLSDAFKKLNLILENDIANGPFKGTHGKTIEKNLTDYKNFTALAGGLMGLTVIAGILAVPAIIGAASISLVFKMLNKTIEKVGSMQAENDNAAKNIQAMGIFVLAVAGLGLTIAAITQILNPDYIWESLGIITATTGLLLGAMWLISKISQDEIQTSMDNIKALQAFTVTVVGLGLAVAVFSLLPLDNIWKGVGYMAAITAGLLATMALMNLINKIGGKDAIDNAKALAIFAGTMILTTAAVALLASIPEDKLYTGMKMVGLVAAGLLGVMLVTALISTIGQASLEGAKALAIFAGVMIGTTLAIQLLSMIPTDNVWPTFGLIMAIGGGMLAIMAAAGLISKYVSPAMETAKAMAVIAGIMVGTTLAIQLLSMMPNENVWPTFGLMMAISAGMVSIMVLAGLSEKYIGTGLKSMGTLAVTAVIMGVMTYAIIEMAKGVSEVGSAKIWETFGLMSAITVEMVAVVAGLGAMSSLTAPALIGIAGMAIIALTATGVMFSIGEMAKTVVEVGSAKIWETFGLFSAITVEMGVVLAALGSLAPLTAGALIGIAGMAGIALTGIGVMFSIGEIAKVDKELGSGAIWSAFGLFSAIIGEMVALAAVIGNPISVALMTPAILTATAIGSMAYNMVKAIDIMVEAANKMNEYNLNADYILNVMKPLFKGIVEMFNDMDTSGPVKKQKKVLEMLSITVGSIDTIVKAMVTMKNADLDGNTAIKYASAMKDTVTGFFDMTMQMIRELAEKNDTKENRRAQDRAINQAKRVIKVINMLIKSSSKMLKMIETFDKESKAGNNIIDRSIQTSRQISEALKAFADGFFKAEDGTDMSNYIEGSITRTRRTLSLIDKLVTVTKHFMKVIESFDKDSKAGNNIIQVAITSAGNISTAIRTFADNFFNNGEGEIIEGSMRRTRQTLDTLDKLVSITGNFMNIVSGLSDKVIKDLETSLDGNTRIDDKVTSKFEDKAVQITNAITTFAHTFFTKIGELDGMMENWYKQYSIKKTMDTLSKTVMLIPDFIKSLEAYTNLTTGENAQTNMQLINNAEGMAKVVGTFCNVLYSNINTLNVKWNNAKNISAILGIMDPVRTLVDMLVQYDSTDGLNLSRVIVDEQTGELKTIGFVNVSNVAMAIGGALTTFLNTLYSSENKDRWRSIWETHRESKEIDNVNKKLGVLGEIIQPITNFTDMLLKFNDNLMDTEGNPVDIIPIGRSIAGSFNGFLSVIYDPNSEWMQIVNNADDVSTASKLKSILDPVKDITEYIGSIDVTKQGTIGFPIFDNDGNKTNEYRIVDFVNVATKINGVITTFTKTMNDTFGTTATKENEAFGNIKRNISDTFTELDKALEKSKNDKRIQEIKRLTDEIKKLAKEVNDIQIEKVNKEIELLNASAENAYAQNAGSSGREGGSGGGRPQEVKVELDAEMMAKKFADAMASKKFSIVVLDNDKIQINFDN